MEIVDSAESLIEREGDGWSFSFDTSPAPEYILLTFRGKASPARTESFLATLAEHEAQLTDAEGRYYPTLVDLSKQPPPTMDAVKGGWAMVSGVARRHNYLVFLVSPERRRNALFGMFLGLIARLTPNRFAVVTTWDEALAEVRAYHERKAR